MRSVLLIVAMLAFCIRADAQTPPGYRLRIPSAEEYLTAVPHIMAQIQADSAQDEYELRKLVSEEFWKRYDDLSLVQFDVLSEAEPYIDRSLGYDASNPESEPGWHELLLRRWLRDNRPDLSAHRVWHFGGYTLHVQPADFTGDGIDELAIQFVYRPGEYILFTEYLALQRDETQAERYRTLEDLYFWFSARCPYQLSCGGAGESRQILDVTGDGLPEWLISRGQCGYGRCSVSLSVFGWRQGQFVDLAPSGGIRMPVASGGGGTPAYPRQGDWIIENTDDDPALEIVQVENLTDNRGCEVSSQQVFSWNEQTWQFQGEAPVIEYADTPWCALRQAHIAMLDADFDAAARHYEHMLTFAPPPDLIDLWQYARIRLAAAYALSERVEDAQALLSVANPEAIEDEMIRSMAEAARSEFSSRSFGKQLCAGLERAIADTYERWEATSILLVYGESNDYGVSRNYVGGDFSPANAGCDISNLWVKTVDGLGEHGGSLREQLEAAGWEIAGEFEFDINEDGIHEALVWPTLLGLAAFQWSDDGELRYSAVPIDRPTEYSQLATISSPNTGNLLVSIAFDPSTVCQVDSFDQPGKIAVWRLGENGLVDGGSQTICAPQSIEETFPNPGEMHLKSTLSGENRVFSWDGEQLRFTLPPESRSVAGSPFENPLVCYGRIYGFCGSLDYPAEALALIDVVLSGPQATTSPQVVKAFTYYRALALEVLGRDDEALALYVSLYEAAPESAWGMLAALHFEMAENE